MKVTHEHRICATGKAPSAVCARPRFALSLLRSLLLLSTLSAVYYLLPASAHAQTELGSEDDLTILGTNGTALDPDTEIKGFTVFGSTQAAYTGAVAGPGSVVVNGALAVSSGAYFVDSSTFPAAGRIFIGDGSTGQILSKKSDGSLQWASSSAMGDNLGNHVATTTLNMAAFDITGVSTMTVSSITTTAAGVTFSTNVFLTGKLGVGTAYPNAKLDMRGNELRLGPVSYPASYSVTNSGYLVMDKSGTAGDASIVFRDQGNARAEIGIVTDNDIHFKTVTGSYGSETFTDRMLMRATGEIDAFGLLRSYGTSGVSRIFAGNSDGATAGAALELSYDFTNTLSRISSIERGNMYRDLVVEANNLRFMSGVSGLAESMRITSDGFVGIGTAAPNVPLYVAGGGPAFANVLVVDTLGKGGGTIVLGNDTVNGDQVGIGINGFLKSQAGSFSMDSTGAPLLFSVNGSEKMRVSANGNIGISSATPAYRLVVSSGAGEAGNMLVISTGTSNVIRMTGAGEIYANKFIGDISGAWGLSGADNLGNHIATTTLQMGAYGINTSSDITAANYQIGGSTVMSASNATYNTVVGFRTAKATSSTYITALGYNAGYSNTTGGINIFLGSNSGYGNTSGSNNTVVGAGAAYFNTTGGENVFVGNGAGYNNASGGGNTVVGRSAGNGTNSNAYSSTTLMGYRAGYALTTGSDNILLGWQAGYNVTSGTGNIVIGYNKNTSAAAANNELNIGGVLYGDLSAKTIGISTRIPQAALDIVSTGTASSIYAQIWRDGSGTIVSSMTSTGVLYPQSTPAGDNLGNHIATTTLQMGTYGVNTSSAITAARYQINGSTVVAVLPGTSSLGIGVNAGAVNAGNYNVFVGSGAGQSNTTGAVNTFVGWLAGNSNTTNTLGNNNTFVGGEAGRYNTQSGNTFVGTAAGKANLTGVDNAIFGYNSGTYVQTGSANAVFGAKAGGFASSGTGFSSSTIMGWLAGKQLTTGYGNIFIGYDSGYNVATGTGNVVIGYSQGTSVAAASNELNIGGVLFGDLAARTIGISTRVPQAALDVVSTGTAANQLAQIWRNTATGIVSSMSATGVMMATKFIGDGSGLTGVGGQAEIFVSTINAAAATPYGGVNITTNTFVSGNVGIGTKNPALPLTIYSNSNTADDTVSIYNPNTGNLAVTGYDLHNNEGTGYLWVGSSNYTGDPVGQSQLMVFSDFKNGLGLAANNGGGIKFYTSGYSQRMTLADNGTVGISTGNPQAALDIVSTGTAANIYAQIWRDSTGVIVSSMTATGKFTAASVQAVSSVAGSYTAYISTSSAAGSYSVAVTSTGVTSINNLVIENRTSDPAAPVTGQIWLRTN